MASRIELRGLLSNLSYGSLSLQIILNNIQRIEKIDQRKLQVGDNSFVADADCIGAIIIFDANVLGTKVLRTTGGAGTGIQLGRTNTFHLLSFPSVGGLTLVINSSNTDAVGFTTVVFF